VKASEYWRGVMDQHKAHRAEAEAKQNGMAQILYGRAEMLARAELELAEAEEVMEARHGR
jgi:hypothetical protein